MLQRTQTLASFEDSLPFIGTPVNESQGEGSSVSLTRSQTTQQLGSRPSQQETPISRASFSQPAQSSTPVTPPPATNSQPVPGAYRARTIIYHRRGVSPVVFSHLPMLTHCIQPNHRPIPH